MSRIIFAFLLIGAVLVAASKKDSSCSEEEDRKKCSKNEVWDPCGKIRIEPTCEGRRTSLKLPIGGALGHGPVCIPEWGRCVCKKGTVRNKKTGKCVNPKECKKDC